MMIFTTPSSDDGSTATIAESASEPIVTEPVPLAADTALSHAVVGIGRFGCVHARKLLSMPGFHLRALVDCSPSARAAGELAALPLLSSLDDMPQDIASATVATCDDAHAEVAMALMRRGCHVLVEKPLCIDRHEGAQMILTARQCGVTLGTGHIERFNPVFDEALLHRLRNAAANHRRGRGTQPFMRFRRCSTRIATARDSVLDLMVHDLDLFAWLCAIPAEAPLELLALHVDAHGVRARVRLDALVAEFESGYGSLPAARLQLCDGHREQWLDLRGAASTAAAGGDDALARQYQGFRRAVLGEPSRIASGADGLAAVTRACQILHA